MNSKSVTRALVSRVVSTTPRRVHQRTTLNTRQQTHNHHKQSSVYHRNKSTKMKLALTLRASKLKNIAGAFHGTSDPYAVVSVVPTDPHGKPYVVGKTEVIKNNLSPDWSKSFILDYELGTPLNFTVSIFDENKNRDNKLMGTAAFEASSVLGAKGNTKAKALPKNGGTLYVRLDKYVATGTLHFKCSGVKLSNVEGMFSKSDPFFEICRKDFGSSGTEWNAVYRSPHIMNNLNPNWNDDQVDLSALCMGDLDAPLLIRVLDYEKDGKHDPMGRFETTVNGFVGKQGREPFTLSEHGKSVGQFVVHSAKISDLEDVSKKMSTMSVSHEKAAPTIVQPQSVRRDIPIVSSTPVPTFVDYISGGCEVSLCVAIDFTGSNGDPRVPGTLHHTSHDGSKNGYEKAITAIGNILAPYDSDKMFPVWGFGAKIGGQVRHCFQVGPKAEVYGVDGIIQAYHQAFASGIVMSGPTDITEVIQTAAAFAISGQEAAKKVGKQKYTILLILTDGGVSDVNHTVSTLENVSTCPLSIVMVGIGGGDFSSMRFLDDRKTTEAKPDICDFVELNSYLNNPDALTKATLSEVPAQLVGYFTRNGIKANPPVTLSDEEIVVEPEEQEIDLSHEFNKDGEIVVTACNYVPPKAY